MKKTDELIANIHAKRQAEGRDYLDVPSLLESLSISLRGLCDFVLTEDSTKEKIAQTLAALIDSIDHAKDRRIH